MNASLVDCVSVGNTLGEGVLWDHLSGYAWWTDIEERRLFRYDPNSRDLRQFDLPERLGSFGFIQGSERFVAAFESGFAYFNPKSGELDWVVRVRHAASNMRLNDGRVDRKGRFWAGSMVEGVGQPTGKLYCLANGKIEVHRTGIHISNSLCFSGDGRSMYFADSPHRQILRFDVDPDSGALSNQTTFAYTSPGAFPDGSIVDSEGHVWNAQWGSSRVVRYAPGGSISGSIELPATQPSCVAFGGDNFDLLFVTAARQDLKSEVLARQPRAGDLFIYKLGVNGCPEPRYRV